jgi:hypothetical protein
MRIRTKIALSIIVCLGGVIVSAGSGTKPLSRIPAEQREAFTKRLDTYVNAYRERKWGKLYDLVSDVGRGGANRRIFVAAMKAEHGTDFAQMPDLLEVRPGRTEAGGEGGGYDIYGCGKARREGMMFNGIAVMHAVHEHNDWFFAGWRFTEFPNEPCKALSDPAWQPENRTAWNEPMEEIIHFKKSGVPFHVEVPH